MQAADSFVGSVCIQWRVVRALLMREIVTRYGRHNIGFFWVFCEPLIFCLGVTMIWLGLHKATFRREAGNLSIVAFTITGYSNVLLWRNCGNRCCQAITPNLALLYHRNVRVLDVLLSRIILEVSGCAMAFLLLVGFFCAINLMDPPANWILLLAGYFMNACFAASLATCVCACSELSEVFEKFWHPVTYFMLPISGLTFMVDWLPQKYQALALTIPMVNGTEMLRGGYFGNNVHAIYSVPYMACWCLGLELVGLLFLKYFSRRVEPQ